MKTTYLKNQQLTDARERAGLTQKQAAEIMDVSRETWCLWENGKREMPKHKFYEFLAKTGQTMADLPKRVNYNAEGYPQGHRYGMFCPSEPSEEASTEEWEAYEAECEAANDRLEAKLQEIEGPEYPARCRERHRLTELNGRNPDKLSPWDRLKLDLDMQKFDAQWVTEHATTAQAKEEAERTLAALEAADPRRLIREAHNEASRKHEELKRTAGVPGDDNRPLHERVRYLAVVLAHHEADHLPKPPLPWKPHPLRRAVYERFGVSTTSDLRPEQLPEAEAALRDALAVAPPLKRPLPSWLAQQRAPVVLEGAARAEGETIWNEFKATEQTIQQAALKRAKKLKVVPAAAPDDDDGRDLA